MSMNRAAQRAENALKKRARKRHARYRKLGILNAVDALSWIDDAAVMYLVVLEVIRADISLGEITVDITRALYATIGCAPQSKSRWGLYRKEPIPRRWEITMKLALQRKEKP